MKIGDLVMPKACSGWEWPAHHPTRVGLILGESFSSYNGELLQVLWPSKAHPMWEPKKYLEKVSEGR